MATGAIKIPSLQDYEKLGTLTWNGITIECWRNGLCVTLSVRGTYTNAESGGAKNQYITIPSKYMPSAYYTYNPMFFTQAGKKLLMAVQGSNAKVGLYYQLDAVSANDAAYGMVSWAARGF